MRAVVLSFISRFIVLVVKAATLVVQVFAASSTEGNYRKPETPEARRWYQTAYQLVAFIMQASKLLETMTVPIINQPTK